MPEAHISLTQQGGEAEQPEAWDRPHVQSPVTLSETSPPTLPANAQQSQNVPQAQRLQSHALTTLLVR